MQLRRRRNGPAISLRLMPPSSASSSAASTASPIDVEGAQGVLSGGGGGGVDEAIAGYSSLQSESECERPARAKTSADAKCVTIVSNHRRHSTLVAESSYQSSCESDGDGHSSMASPSYKVRVVVVIVAPWFDLSSTCNEPIGFCSDDGAIY